MAVGLLPRYIRSGASSTRTSASACTSSGTASLLEDAVVQGVADFAIGPPPVRAWDGPLAVIAWEEFVIVLPPDDPLAGRTVDPARRARRP